MTSGVNTYRFKLQNQRTKERSMKKRAFLTTRLQELGVRVNNPDEMSVKQLELLVNSHRKTVEARKVYISKEQLKVAEANKLTKEEIINRVDLLNWDVENAVAVKSTAQDKRGRREIRRQERMRVIQEMHESEMSGNNERFEELERELAGI